jgi:hypothetical protein
VAIGTNASYRMIRRDALAARLTRQSDCTYRTHKASRQRGQGQNAAYSVGWADYGGTLLNRRRTLALLGGAGAAVIGARIGGHDVDAATCVNLAGAQTEGPYWVEENLNRSDIRVDPADGSIRPGVMLNLTVNVQNISGTSCTALAGARVDVWHCDAGGTYSDEAANSSTGHKYLRGHRTTDDTGSVRFTTIYPGW